MRTVTGTVTEEVGPRSPRPLDRGLPENKRTPVLRQGALISWPPPLQRQVPERYRRRSTLSERPFYPRGSSVVSGLISYLWARFPICSGLHITPVELLDSRHACGLDSTPGFFVSRYGPPGGWPGRTAFDTPFQAPCRLHNLDLFPHGSRSVSLSAHSLDTAQSSALG